MAVQVWRRCVYHWEPVLITCSCSPSEGTPINAPPLLSHPPPPPPPSHPSLLLPCHMAPSFSSHKILPSITLRPPADISSSFRYFLERHALLLWPRRQWKVSEDISEGQVFGKVKPICAPIHHLPVPPVAIGQVSKVS